MSGQINADNAYNSAGNGPMNFPDGLTLGGLDAITVYKVAGEQALTNPITWNAGLAPSGSPSLVYKWIQIGKLVTFYWRFNYSSSGTTIIGAYFQIPADLPAPSLWTGGGGNNSYSYNGQSLLSILGSGASNAAQTSLDYNDAISGQWALYMQCSSTTAKNWQGQVSYMTA